MAAEARLRDHLHTEYLRNTRVCKLMKKQHVYSFADGDGRNKKLLGGKGANLCEMTQIGLNVPPGFVITTEACLDYLDGGGLPDGLLDQVREQIGRLEKATGKTFGTEIEFVAADGGLLVVYFGYTNCPDVCPTPLDMTARALDELDPGQRTVLVANGGEITGEKLKGGAFRKGRIPWAKFLNWKEFKMPVAEGEAPTAFKTAAEIQKYSSTGKRNSIA